MSGSQARVQGLLFRFQGSELPLTRPMTRELPLTRRLEFVVYELEFGV